MRFYLSLYVAKIINFTISLLGMGAGYTWPGHVALKIFPNILAHSKMKFPKGVILISGTNGKTTTSKLLTHILEENNLKVIHNRTGANLVNGIVSEVLLNMNFWGNHNADIAVFEVDENNLPLVLNFIDPNVLVLLNLSRDQLDRYAEVDLILDKWQKSIEALHADTELVLDSTQKYFNALPQHFKGEVTYFDASTELLKLTNLVGGFNAKNINAAVFTSELVGVSEDAAKNSLKSFEYAYGRGETVGYENKDYKIVLAKNPASFNSNLDAIVSGEISGDAMFFILNDNIPDGRDVSWIYDIDSELLNKACVDKKIYIAGTRAFDMAVRLQYCDVVVSNENVFSSLEAVLTSIASLETSSDLENVIVLPNYSAMLNVRKLLTGKSIL